MRYDPGGQGIQLLRRYLRLLCGKPHGVRGSCRRHCMVWRQQKRRMCSTALLGRGRIIIYTFNRTSLVLHVTLAKFPRVHNLILKLLPHRQETAFQDVIRSNRGRRCGSTNSSNAALSTLMPPAMAGSGMIVVSATPSAATFWWRSAYAPRFGRLKLPSSRASTCFPKTFRFHSHPSLKTTAPCMPQVYALQAWRADG